MATDISDKGGGKVLIGVKEYTNMNNVRVKVRQRADTSIDVLIRTDQDVMYQGKGADLTVEGAPSDTDPDTLRDQLTAFFDNAGGGAGLPAGGSDGDILIRAGATGKWLPSNSINPPVTIDDISDLVANFDFSDTSTISLSGNLIQTITDKVGSVISSASGASPVYMSDGTLGKGFFARFTGTEQLVGDLLPAAGDYTLFVVRRIAAGTTSSGFGNAVFQNGNGNGYAIVDFQAAGDIGGKVSGGFYPGVAVGAAVTEFTNLNKWEVVAISHTTGVNKQYNSNGTIHGGGQSNPHTPTTSHTIGGCSSVNNFKGDISEIMLFSRQLTDAEAQRVCNFLTQRNISVKPQEIVFDGHSKMGAAGGAPDILDYLIDGLRTDGYYVSQYNGAGNGLTFQQVIQNMSSVIFNRKAVGVTSIFGFMCGHNDIGSSTADVLIQNTISVMSAARSLGYKAIIFTDLRTTINDNVEIDAVNTYIRAHWAEFADALFDSAALIDQTDTTLLADGIHPTPKASLILATAAKPTFEEFLTL